jgi:hypothetical protein
VRLKGYACSAALVALAAAAIPMRALTAQQVGRDSTVRDSVTVQRAAGDTLARPPVPLSMRLRKDTLFLARPPVFGDFGRLGGAREATEAMARRRTDALQNAHALRQSALWSASVRRRATAAEASRAPPHRPKSPNTGERAGNSVSLRRRMDSGARGAASESPAAGAEAMESRTVESRAACCAGSVRTGIAAAASATSAAEHA